MTLFNPQNIPTLQIRQLRLKEFEYQPKDINVQSDREFKSKSGWLLTLTQLLKDEINDCLPQFILPFQNCLVFFNQISKLKKKK